MRAAWLLLAAFLLPVTAAHGGDETLHILEARHAWDALAQAEVFDVLVENTAETDATHLRAWIWRAPSTFRVDVALSGTIPAGEQREFQFSIPGAPLVRPCVLVFGRDTASHEECILTGGVVAPTA